MDGEGKKQTKYMPDSLACIPANFNGQHRHSFQISAQCSMWFSQAQMQDDKLGALVNLRGTVVIEKVCKLLLYMKYCNTEFQGIKVYFI